MVAPGATLYFNNTREILPNIGDSTFTAYHTISDILNLTGDCSIYFSSGALYENIGVSGSNNIISGSGVLNGAITFANSSSYLILDLIGSLMSPVDLQGGTLILANDITMYQPNCFISPGMVDLQQYTMSFDYVTSATNLGAFAFSAPITWISNNGGIELTNDPTLLAPWIIQGVCTIDGNYNALNFGNEGQLIIAPGSQLILKNLDISVINSSNIICADNTGQLILNNVFVNLNSDWTFAQGTINFVNDVTLSGPNIFEYLSNIPALIADESTLSLDGGVTYKLGRATVGGPDPLMFYGKNSIIATGQCNFIITASGFALTTGQVQLKVTSWSKQNLPIQPAALCWVIILQMKILTCILIPAAILSCKLVLLSITMYREMVLNLMPRAPISARQWRNHLFSYHMYISVKYI